MTETQLSLTLPPHNNQQLFSDHYLNEVLPVRKEWLELQSAALAALVAIQEIFERYVPSANESQTEEDLIKPILRLLGHTFEVQPALTTPDGAKRPDYVLYRTEQDLASNKQKQLNEDLLRNTAYAVADAKYWNRPLDVALKGSKGDPFNNRNPSYQISFYMQHSGLPWGILTNGRIWRIYHRDTAHKLDRFYEVDLEALAQGNDLNRFLYFYAFFRRDAFEPGPIGLQELLRESIDYALKIGNQLKSQVFDALRHLAQGFLDYPGNHLSQDPEMLKEIYDSSLILLYRLLFVFYAEARELLPLRESRDYRDSYSLYSITRDIARTKQDGRHLLPTSGKRWAALKELFAAIDLGSPPLHVATFNGGLFDPVRHQFLQRNSVGNRHLDDAIDTLARVQGQFVDYRDLAEQHLGTIYEGLLEYHLDAIEPEEGWQIDLLNDRGERKKIGSYYTPNYIVKYIVDQTVGPILQQAVAGKTDDEKIAAILRVNVLDPAMGSAYFLVEATEYIARFIVNLDLPRPGKEESDDSDLAYWKRQVVQSCVYGVDINPLAVELAKLSLWLSTVAKDRPLSFLDHHLRCGNSIVGSRSMMTRRSEHQRKAATKRAKQAAAAASTGQLSLVDDNTFQQKMRTAVDSMWLIESNAGATVEDVKTQEQLFASLHADLIGRYGRLADLVTAADFGMEIDDKLWPVLTEYALGRALLVPPAFQQWIATAEATAKRERFFHWDLEFPEVFYDRFGRSLGDDAGFDAIVGNPPYVRQERFASTKPYLRQQYASFHSVADLYIYFFERGLQLLEQSGRLGYISSGTFARGNFAKPFRAYLPTAAQIEQVIDFGENQPFVGAEMVRPTILTMQKGLHLEGFRSLFIADSIPASLDNEMALSGTINIADSISSPEWNFQVEARSELASRLLFTGRPLGEYAGNGKIYRGILTGLNEAFVITRSMRDGILGRDQKASAFVHKLATGQDHRPWYVEDEERYIIVIPTGWTRKSFGSGLTELDAWLKLTEQHPSISSHLEPFTDLARKRGDKGDYWWELRPCDYYDAFELPKIVFPDIAKLPRFSLDDSGSYLNNTAYFIPGGDFSLLGILQSRAIWFAISQISQPLRLRAGLWQYRLFPQFLTRLPIPGALQDVSESIAELARLISAASALRYAKDAQAHKRIQSDLGTPETKLNQKLTAWWTLDFSAFRAEIKKVFKLDIPVRERDEWEAWLTEQRAEHERLTNEIIRLETELNAIVYQLFDLSADDIAIIEESTKYQYGEV